MKDDQVDQIALAIEILEERWGGPTIKIEDAAAKAKAIENFWNRYRKELAACDKSLVVQAAKYLVETRKGRGFPLAEEMVKICEALKKQADRAKRRDEMANKRDPWNEKEQREADDLFCDNRGLSRQAIEDGWGTNLWWFMAEQGRLPDDNEQRKLISDRYNFDLLSRDLIEHPHGGVCEECAVSRGARRTEHSVEDPWVGDCIRCGALDKRAKTLISVADWIWPAVSFSFSKLAVSNRKFLEGILRKREQQEGRLKKLVGA